MNTRRLLGLSLLVFLVSCNYNRVCKFNAGDSVKIKISGESAMVIEVVYNNCSEYMVRLYGRQVIRKGTFIGPDDIMLERYTHEYFKEFELEDSK